LENAFNFIKKKLLIFQSKCSKEKISYFNCIIKILYLKKRGSVNFDRCNYYRLRRKFSRPLSSLMRSRKDTHALLRADGGRGGARWKPLFI